MPAAPRVTGLLVDWGGVLTPSLGPAMKAWADTDGVDYEHFGAVMRDWVGSRDDPAAEAVRDSPVHALERGEMSPVEFEAALATSLARHGSAVDARGLLGRLLGPLAVLDAGMLALVRASRAGGVRTGLLSNSWGEHYPQELFDGLFDAIVISGRVGMRKPEERIFVRAAADLGLAPHQCAFVDDLPPNVEAARALGFTAVLHTDALTTAAALEPALGVELVAAVEAAVEATQTASQAANSSSSPPQV